METSAVSTATTRSQTSSASASSNKGLVSSDFQTFLKMLTAQLQNQDPLNPMQSTDFAVQLATFSGVEQQVRTNDLLSELSSQMGLMGLTQLGNLIGNEVRSDAPVLFEGEPVGLYFDLPASAEGAELVVRDESNREVSRIPVVSDSVDQPWVPTRANGTPLPEGIYRLSVELPGVGEAVTSVPVETYAQVVETRMTDGSPALLLKGGIEVLSSQVSGFRLS